MVWSLKSLDRDTKVSVFLVCNPTLREKLNIYKNVQVCEATTGK